MEEPVQALRRDVRQNRRPKRRGVMRRGTKVPEGFVLTLSRKASSEEQRCPYRKPTQVGEKSILRRAEELSLRNSAK
jgi:hypothetical protein